jgi:hypothetical protein
VTAVGIVLRHAGRFVTDQLSYCVRVGAWWIPLAGVILGIAAIVAATAQVVVPTAVYVFF